ncbi:MAG: DUF2061 domain-containing protein [Phycisphaerae bacterium]|nr:DUF2061 domain-containing protein [Phycisphaerae bacterium]
MESHLRSIAKALSYRFVGTVATFFVALIVTRKMDLALQIGIAEPVIKLAVFYGHERLWGVIKFGRKTPPDYEI